MFLAHSFAFLNPGDLSDGEILLCLHETIPPIGVRAPSYRFHIRRAEDRAKAGRIELRVANTSDILLYAGHIGYHVDTAFRGRHYAARACRLLYDLARRHGLREIWITCDPDNLASRRTCELAGASFVSIVAVPEYHPFYKAGSHAKCRFRLDLNSMPVSPAPAVNH